MQLDFWSKYRRFRLSHFLLACTVIGALIGVIGGAYLNRTTYRKLSRSCEGYLVESMWEKKPFESERLVYLVAYAKGPVGFGCSSAYAGDHPLDWGVSRIASGIYLGPQKVSSPDQKYWIYSAYEGKWGKLQPISKSPQEDVSSADFERLEYIDLWKLHFKPLLDTESATFAQKYKEATDPQGFWNRVFQN